MLPNPLCNPLPVLLVYLSAIALSLSITFTTRLFRAVWAIDWRIVIAIGRDWSSWRRRRRRGGRRSDGTESRAGGRGVDSCEVVGGRGH